MKYLKLCVFLAIGLAATVSCKSQYELLLASGDVDAKYDAAMEYFHNKKYQKAAQLFESMAVLTSGTERDDTVQYYWGLSNYRYKDYYTAESNFASLIENFPRSPFAAEAQFYRLDCQYRATYRWELDQLPTRACITTINQYMRERPDDIHIPACQAMLADLQDRLDRKDFEAGRLYYKMEDYPAARLKLQNVLKTNAENNYREEVLYYTAMSSYHYARLSVAAKQKDRYLTFVDDYLNFVGEYPESGHRSEMDRLYRQVQKILGRGGETQETAE